MAKQKSYVARIQDALHPFVADAVSRRKDGTIVIRRGYFYRHGKDAEDFRIAVCKVLNKTDIQYSIKDYGDHWAAFKGGASLAKQSHWWVELWPEQVDILA
mgnify:FL=1